MRAMPSVFPPGAKGTMILTGFCERPRRLAQATGGGKNDEYCQKCISDAHRGRSIGRVAVAGCHILLHASIETPDCIC
jgi:hypothetical protein